MLEILYAILRCINGFFKKTAEAIDNREWNVVVVNSIPILIVLAIIILILITICRRIPWKLIGWIAVIFGGLFCLNKANMKRQIPVPKAQPDEELYSYLRNAVFLVLRAMSEFCPVVKPGSMESVELPNGIAIRQNYIVYNFLIRLEGEISPEKLKRFFTETMGQMIRAHKLEGLPSDLVCINGIYSSPIIVMDVVDYGDSATISLVFADKITIELAKKQRLLNLELQKGKDKLRRKETDLFDDEL